MFVYMWDGCLTHWGRYLRIRGFSGGFDPVASGKADRNWMDAPRCMNESVRSLNSSEFVDPT